MDTHYYIVSLLPTLFFGREAGISIEGFLEESGKWMSEKEFEKLSAVDINDFSIGKTDAKVMRQFKNFEAGLRNDIASWRKAQKRDLDYKPETFPPSILKEGNPLDAEMKLMELRWNFLEELEREHYFDLGTLILYYLKLQLLQRIFTFDKEEGLKKFQKLYEVNV